MVYRYNTINNIPIYVDPLMEDNSVLKGHKEGSDNYYLIANEKTAKYIYSSLLITERKNKLNKINDSNRSK